MCDKNESEIEINMNTEYWIYVVWMDARNVWISGRSLNME